MKSESLDGVSQRRETNLFSRFDTAIGLLQKEFDRLGWNHRSWKNQARILLAEMDSIYGLLEEEKPIQPGRRDPEQLIREAEGLLIAAEEFKDSL